MKLNRGLNPQRINFMGRIRGPFFFGGIVEQDLNVNPRIVRRAPRSLSLSLNRCRKIGASTRMSVRRIMYADKLVGTTQ